MKDLPGPDILTCSGPPGTEKNITFTFSGTPR